MGVVFKAEDTRLRRTVALKFLAPELTRDEDSKRRFIHEAQAASALDHPNICSIFDIDETPEGQLFIAMACYEGESLKERIARRRLEVREAFEIAFSVGQGLARAHASNIIHRDVKPGNVMITNDGFVKIVDFGLAKLIGRSRVTGSGTTLGTVAYMSPEQARSEEVDARVDIWSLGAILYEMLTGALPFRGEIDQAVVYSILNEAPRPVRELRGDVPEPCAGVVMKCLEKDPARRYQSAAEFCDALIVVSERLGWGSFATGSVRAVSVVRGGGRRRRRIALPLAASLVVLALAGTFAWREWHGRSIYSTKVRLLVMPFERLGDTPSQAFVDGLSEWTSSILQRSTPLQPSMWVVPYAWVLKDRPADVEQAQATFGVNTVVTGTIQRFGSRHRLTLSLLRDAAASTPAEVVLDLDENEIAPDSFALAIVRLVDLKDASTRAQSVAGLGTTHPAAVASYLTGLGCLQRPESVTNARDAISALSAASAADTAFLAAQCALARAYYEEDHPTGDPSLFRRAEQTLDRVMARDPTLVDGHKARASIYLDSEDTEHLQQAIDELKLVVEIEPWNLEMLQALGYGYAIEKRYDETERCYQEMAHVAPDLSQAYSNLGWLYHRLDRSDDELAVTLKAVALAPGDWWALNRLGFCYFSRGDLRRAREAWERSYAVRPECNNSSNVGMVMYLEGRFNDSVRFYEYALERCDSTDYTNWAALASALYWAEGKRERALKVYGRAIALARARIRAAPDDGETLARLADYYAMVGEPDSSRQFIARAAGYHDAQVSYRVACAYEKLGEREKALQYVAEAIRQEFPLPSIEREPLFRDLVRDPRYRPTTQSSTKE